MSKEKLRLVLTPLQEQVLQQIPELIPPELRDPPLNYRNYSQVWPFVLFKLQADKVFNLPTKRLYHNFLLKRDKNGVVHYAQNMFCKSIVSQKWKHLDACATCVTHPSQATPRYASRGELAAQLVQFAFATRYLHETNLRANVIKLQGSHVYESLFKLQQSIQQLKESTRVNVYSKRNDSEKLFKANLEWCVKQLEKIHARYTKSLTTQESRTAFFQEVLYHPGIEVQPLPAGKYMVAFSSTTFSSIIQRFKSFGVWEESFKGYQGEEWYYLSMDGETAALFFAYGTYAQKFYGKRYETHNKVGLQVVQKPVLLPEDSIMLKFVLEIHYRPRPRFQEFEKMTSEDFITLEKAVQLAEKTFKPM